MSDTDRTLWDEKWLGFEATPEVSSLLIRHASMLASGVALDVACGIGQNSLWLARRGYRVLGVDLSRVGLEQARQSAAREGLLSQVQLVQVDLDAWRPAPGSVDLLCVMRFLDRRLVPALRRAVRVGGLVAYLTRHVGVLEGRPDANRAYLLRPGELLQLFEGWEVVVHEVGETEAGLIARKTWT